MFTVLAALALAADPPGGKPRNPTVGEVEKAQTRLTAYLDKINGKNTRVAPLTEEGVGATFPNHVLFGVTFPQYPVARAAPEPLKSSNVVAVAKKDGKVTPITDPKELEAFFKEYARRVEKPGDGFDALRAWLWASAALAQDGFFKFTVKLDETPAKVGRGYFAGSGAAEVIPQGGNKGAIRATLTFQDGKLAKVEEERKVVAGVRPICQATKLLDPDPIVRGMAEQALLVMGRSAKPYLDEQRAKAAPELRAAIDRVWRRIVEEDR